MRSDNESDERIISGLDYLNDNGGGLLWVPNNDSSYLRVGPVNVTYYNQSTYQCIILRNDNNTNSDIATLEVVDIPTVEIMMVTDNCLDVTANWSPITGECSNSTFNVTLLSASGNRVMMTNGTSYTFDNTVMLSGDISVSVVAFNGDATGATNQVDAQPSLTNVPSISNPMEVENCVSYYNLNWTDTTQCIPVSYTVVLTNTSSGEMHSSTTDVTSYNFTELTSNTNYTVCITGRNRVGLSDAMMEFKTPHSAVPPRVMGVMPSTRRTFQNVDDIMISWTKPMIENVCHTSAISHYMVQISYSRSGDKSVKSGYSAKIPANRTSILMSEEFKNHPMIMTTYNITVFAFNEGGRSNPSAIETISSSESDNTGLIIGGVVGTIVAVIVLIIIGIVLYYCYCFKERSNSGKADQQYDRDGTPTSSVRVQTLDRFGKPIGNENVDPTDYKPVSSPEDTVTPVFYGTKQGASLTTQNGQDQQEYGYARTGPIAVVMEGGTSVSYAESDITPKPASVKEPESQLHYGIINPKSVQETQI
ncbi:uncharacterized protein [Dysidea avara]